MTNDVGFQKPEKDTLSYVGIRAFLYPFGEVIYRHQNKAMSV